MKKIFISALAIAMGVSAMAAETAYVQIKLTAEGGGVSSIFLTEDNAHTNAFEPGVDVEKMMTQSNSKSVLLYGLVGTTPCEDVVALNLDELKIGMKTNQVAQNYTMTFIDFSGRELTLLDKVTNQVITINATTPAYNFSVEAAQVGQKAIDDRFVIGGTPLAESLCFNNNILEVNGYAGKSLVIKQGASEIENIPSLPAMKSIPLGAYTGRLVVTLDGKDYQIDVNPAVTKYTPAP